MAVAALVLGIVGLAFSFVGFGILPAIVGLVLSILSLRKEKNGMSIAGLICSIIGIVIAIIAIIGFATNEDGAVSKTVDDTRIESSSDKKGNLAEQMQVQEYSCMAKYSDMRYVAFYITNPTDKDVSISMNVTAKDADGNALASSSPSEEVVAGNSSTILTAFLDNVDMSAQIDYTMNVEASTYYKSAASDIDLQYNVNGDQVVFTATNNGKSPAKFLTAKVIFLSDGQMVGVDETYIMDDSSSAIQPGETRTGQASNYGDAFDDVIVAYTARV